jgi:hypothetical protein
LIRPREGAREGLDLIEFENYLVWVLQPPQRAGGQPLHEYDLQTNTRAASKCVANLNLVTLRGSISFPWL